jgi:hypothetical protein
MAINPEGFASWGLLAAAGGPPGIQVVKDLEVTLESQTLLEVSLEATEITVELSDG